MMKTMKIKIKPVLKWVGGKTQILETVLSLMPNEIENYHEPFVGGGSVLFATLSEKKINGLVRASDTNANLINLYKVIQSEPLEFIRELNILKEEYNAIKDISGSTSTSGEINRNPLDKKEAIKSKESYYYWIRSRFNKPLDESNITLSAMMLFLNKTNFRGLYREGPNGYNVPFGHNVNPRFLNEEHILTVSNLIKNVIFTCCSFVESFKSVSDGIDGDFIYLDPPYVPINNRTFVDYGLGGFSLKDHTELFELCKKVRCKMLMSNSDVKLVRDSFSSGFTIQHIVCRRAIHCKNPESKADEVLIFK